MAELKRRKRIKVANYITKDFLAFVLQSICSKFNRPGEIAFVEKVGSYKEVDLTKKYIDFGKVNKINMKRMICHSSTPCPYLRERWIKQDEHT